MEDIAGRSVFITGAARGIGLGIARAFAKAGAKVALADLDSEALASAAAELSAVTEVATFELDVRDRAAFAGVADAAEAALGPISVLCNNAGVGTSFGLGDMTFEAWDLVLNTNLGGEVNGVQTFLPRMLARGEGHIVNTSSAAGLGPQGGNSGFIYDTSKVAIVGLSEALAKTIMHTGLPIGVSVLCPGPVASDSIDTCLRAEEAIDTRPAEVRAEKQAWWEQRRAPLQEYGLDPDLVGEMVVAGVRANKLYILTDRTMVELIPLRTQALLEAMPEETEHDRRVAAAIAEAIAAYKAAKAEQEAEAARQTESV